MRRLLLTLRYDGTAYHGWQVQPNAVSVQETLQNAIEALTGTRAGVIGCSRTDTGVHAEMFCCTFDTDCDISAYKMPLALNMHLPEDIAVYDCKEVPADFHPRYAARGKRYCYRVWNSHCRNPFIDTFVTKHPYPLDAEQLHRFAQAYVGTHDFSAFCAAGADTVDAVRTVTAFSVERQGDMVTFTVEANGFLYNMVRIMVGTLLDMAAGRLPVTAIETALHSGKRESAGTTAPAKGLRLEKVLYEEVTVPHGSAKA